MNADMSSVSHITGCACNNRGIEIMVSTLSLDILRGIFVHMARHFLPCSEELLGLRLGRGFGGGGGFGVSRE